MTQSAKAANDISRAWDWLVANFPFDGYVREGRKQGYMELVGRLQQWVADDAKVFDFGAGPCDKSAMFSRVGMRVTAFDDLQDPWHLIDGNRERILKFAASAGIDYRVSSGGYDIDIEPEAYDVVMAHDVIEHFHSSPRLALNSLVGGLRVGGVLMLTVPNAVNLRKRLDVVRGRTNYPKFEKFYWYPGEWRGHVREYTDDDLSSISDLMGLELLDLSDFNLRPDAIPARLRGIFGVVSSVIPGLKDSWMLLARKPTGWVPRNMPSEVQFRDAFGSESRGVDRESVEWQG